MRIIIIICVLIGAVTLCYAAEELAVQELVKQGFVALQSGQGSKGIDLLEKALDQQPQNQIALVTLAQAYTDFKSDYEKSIELYQQALEINANYDMAHFGLGLTYQAMGMKEQARKEFERTVALTEKPTVKRVAQQALDQLSS